MDYRKNGANHGGHHEQLHHKAIDMKWSDYLYAVFHDFHVLQYYNYARPGAVIDAEIIPPGLETYGTLQTQLDEFGELFTPLPGPAKVNWHSDDSLFVVFFGINDMGRMNREDLGRKDIKNTSKALAKSLVDSCRRLHKLGAESILIMNLPPLDVSPKYNLPHETGVDSHELIGRSVVEYNRALAQEIAKWKDELEAETDGQKENRAKIMLFDLESFWSLVMRYPEAFGMTECARYEMYVDQKRPNKGRMGYCYHDNQHISWSSAELIARTVNGFLHRHSISFQENNATETALYA
ncbi:hypothetical protein BD324DRAFT_613692 [Kockovaella imperatae]|uniref:SGNH hydrolase-type esterase domain-containing protein n=1 Tax=Kockovaella imperatae TaxID=4999 RepID=A0A1Y1UT75_9TREE|nr:hypothetical protein BD324DRAFT_613692 [Kockovaella imperatae]ORX41223.1 hypothetical protein BD324DRAFT_613692 [Kockovaella imperatae]